MRSLLEKAIVHLLNEDNDAATALFHQFMVERARQIHTSLRQGNDIALSEGWDDELSQEEYFADGDLDDLVDDESEGEESPISGEEGEEDFDDMSGDDGMNGMGDGMEDDGMGDMGEEGGGDVTSRLDDIEDHLETLSREFEEMMAEIDGEDVDLNADTEDMDTDTADMDDDTADMDDDTAEVDDDSADMDADTETEDEHAFAESEETDEDDDGLDDITESVIAELEKVLVGDMQTDGDEVGDGGKIKNGNSKSALTMKKANSDDAGPIKSKNVTHTGYERETPPVSPKPVKLKSRNKVNDTNGKPSDLKSVPKGGDGSALLNKDFAGLKKGNSKSVID